jgi:hypothetical protein
VVACGSRTIIDAVFGPTGTGEIGYVPRLLGCLRPGMLLPADRNADLLPGRRTRVCPRVVKRAISKHRAKGDIDRTNYQAKITINILTTTTDLTSDPPP